MAKLPWSSGAVGIGFSACKALAVQSASIVIADMKNAAAAAERLRKQGFNASHADADVSSEEDTQRMAEVALREGGSGEESAQKKAPDGGSGSFHTTAVTEQRLCST